MKSKKTIRGASSTSPASAGSVFVSVRWHDGYLEEFTAAEVRFGSDLLWMRLANGSNRHIPLRSVRWFSTTPESHAKTPNKGISLKG